jgi:hypothetical protein
MGQSILPTVRFFLVIDFSHTTDTVIETDVTNDRDPFWLMVLDWPLLSVFGWQSNLYSSLSWNNESQYCFFLLSENKSSVREDPPACRLTSYLAVWFAPKQVVRSLTAIVSSLWEQIECTRRPPCLSAHQLFSGVVCAKTGCSFSHCDSSNQSRNCFVSLRTNRVYEKTPLLVGSPAI